MDKRSGLAGLSLAPAWPSRLRAFQNQAQPYLPSDFLKPLLLRALACRGEPGLLVKGPNSLAYPKSNGGFIRKERVGRYKGNNSRSKLGKLNQ